MKNIYLVLLYVLLGIHGYSQEIVMGSSPVVTRCGGLFTDSGGSNDKYQNDEQLTTTICADRKEGTHIRLTFHQIDIAVGDRLCFFDGTSTTAPQLACAEDYYNGFPFIVQSTAANSSGCLTISWNADGSETGFGWAANLDCVASCQMVEAVLVEANPAAMPPDTGWIDICPGETVAFTARGNYPQNGLFYDQSDQSSTFEWDFGDGTTKMGTSVSHTYQESGGYEVTLKVTDVFGCTNSNYFSRRVRVAPPPVFQIENVPSPVCLDQTATLSGSLVSDNFQTIIETAPGMGSFLFKGIRSDSLPLPDGNGTSYQTSIRFTDFEPGQVLESLQELRSICVNMEHSWLHDMEISITCPSGKTVKLQNQEIINKEVYLGNPVDNDGVNPQAGNGKEYCWNPRSNRGTFTEFALNRDQSGPAMPYILPAGAYNSYEDLENLLGCPLNGDWIITVTDLWEQDNGWIFSWSIEIDPNLYPSVEMFEDPIISYGWQPHPDILEQSDQNITVEPQIEGVSQYTFMVETAFGCTYDTTLSLEVLPAGDDECSNCADHIFLQNEITICEGDSVDLGALVDPLSLGIKEFDTSPNYEFSFSSHNVSNPYNSSLNVRDVAGDKVAADGSSVVAVCLSVSSTYNADLNFILESPNGVQLDLSSENGGNSDGYQDVCFTMQATQPIVSARGPFSGDYLPEEPFSKLAGSDINGEWTLRVFDDAGVSPSDVNVLQYWSIIFAQPDAATFLWSPDEEITCTDCLDARAAPDQSTTYYLRKELDGCVVEDSVRVHISANQLISNLRNFQLPNGELLLEWPAVEGAAFYEININNTGWQVTDELTTHTVSGLQDGEQVEIAIRVVTEESNCRFTPFTETIEYFVCDLTAALGNNTRLPGCADSADGSVEIRATGGLAPYEYRINGQPFSTLNTFDSLVAGTYTAVVKDNSPNCADTLNFELIAPPSLTTNFVVEDISCNGANDGRIAALFSGGVGNYNVLGWTNTNETSPIITQLTPGKYWITVTDANNCISVDTTMVEEPAPLSITPTQSPVSCIGGNDGAASIKIAGGTPAYQVVWENGQVGEQAVGLSAGNYRATITDDEGCQAVDSVQVTQPDSIKVNFISAMPSCNDTADGQLFLEVSGGIAPYQYLWENGNRASFGVQLDSGIYFVTVTDAADCPFTTSFQLNAPPPLVASIQATAPACHDAQDGIATASVTGGSAPYELTWSDPEGSTTPEISGLKAGDYEITATDQNNCTITAAISLANPEPLESMIETTPVACSGLSDGTLSLSATGGSYTYDYRWSNGSTDASQTNLPAGEYYVTITDGQGCQIRDTATIESPPPVIIDSIQVSHLACFGENTGAVQVFASGGQGDYNFLINNQPVVNPISNLSAGFYEIVVEDQTGCQSDPFTQVVTQPDNPLAIFSLSSDVTCFDGKDGGVIVRAEGGTAPYEYSWHDSLSSARDTLTNLAAGTYRVTVTDQNGCEEEKNVEVRQPSMPVAAVFNQTRQGCFGTAQNEAAIQVTGGNGAPFLIEWGSGATGNTATSLPAGPVEIIIQDNKNCQDTFLFEIADQDAIIIDLAAVTPSCYNTNDGRLAVTDIRGGSGSYTFEDYQINWNTEPDVQQEFITSLSPDSSYSVTVTAPDGCQNTTTRTMSKPDAPTFRAQKEDVSCYGFNNGIIRIDSFVSNALLASLAWNGGAIDTNVITGLSAGTYEISATDEDGCTAVRSIVINEPPELLIVGSTITPNQCHNDNTGGITVEVAGGTPDYEYQWSAGDSDSKLQMLKSGDYAVTITDQNQCEITEHFTIVPPDPIMADINIGSATCFEDSFIEVEASGGQPPFRYSLDGQNFNSEAKFSNLSGGNYAVFVQDANNCLWESKDIEVTVPPAFEVELTPLRSIVIGDTAIISATPLNATGKVMYDWSSDQPESYSCANEDCRIIEAAPQRTATYELLAIDESGCQTSSQLQLLVSESPRVMIPTGFSPNGDNKNDRLLVHGMENVKILRLQIYNRWGELVFEETDLKTNQVQNTWDGTVNGTPANTGVFTWVLLVEILNGEEKILKGHTTLIR